MAHPDDKISANGNELKVRQRRSLAADIFQADLTVRTLLDSLADGGIVIDRTGSIVFANARAAGMFGYGPDELVDKPHHILVPEALRELHARHQERFFRSPAHRRMAERMELSAVRRDGSEFPVEISLCPLETIGGTLVLALVSDLSLRQEVVQGLRKKEELFHLQMETVTDYAVYPLDPQGHVLNWNPGAQRLEGYREEEIVGEHFSCFYPKERDRQSLDGLLERAARQGRVKDEGWRVRRDGSRFWAEVTIAALWDERGQLWGFSNVTHDMRERRAAEDALRESEEKFSKIFNLAPVGITITTLDGRFVDINETAEKLSGYRREEIVGRNVADVAIWKDLADRARTLEEVARKGSVRGRDLVMKDKNGNAVFVSYSAVEIEVRGERYLLSLVADIGESKRAQEAMRESEERFRLLAEAAPVMIWESGPDGGSTFFNRTWLEYTGRNLGEELGDGWRQCVHPEDLDRCVETYQEAFNAGSRFCMEYRLRRKDGGYGWVAATGVPRFDPDGKLLGYLGSCFDITERKRVKEELESENELLAQKVSERTVDLTRTIERLQEEISERILTGQKLQEEINERRLAQAELSETELLLIHQSRLAAMGEMIGNIAHQWRQPLNLLGLLAQDLRLTQRQGEFSPEYLENNVQKMLETIRFMSKTIDDFRNFFKPGKEKEDFAVVEAVQGALSLLDSSLEAQKIRVDLSVRGNPVINGYPNEFAQVILNIVTNARDAFASGNVSDPTIAIEIGAERERTLVSITDNAGGIPEELIDKIFEPYFTTKGPDKGTGVGLFMSKNIVEKNMGGSLTARNVGGGAQFRIVI